MLSEEHRQFLLSSAIPDEFHEHIDSYDEGILFRLTGPSGRTIEQRRPDRPKGGAKYLTDPGECLLLPIPQIGDYPSRISGGTAPVLIVEGTKQHLAAAAALVGTNYAVVGVLGCWGWVHDGGTPLPDIYAIPWDDREVYVCLDADVTTNPNVWDAARRLDEVLSVECGAGSVRFVTLVGGAADGFDDVMARQPEDRRESVARRLIDRSTSRLPRRPVRRRPFFGRDGLLVDDLFRAIERETPLAALEDHTIAAYANGVYHNGQSLMFEAQVSSKLGNDYRPVHEVAVREHALRILKAEGKVIQARQPASLVNVRNGLLNPVTLELLPHSPDFRSLVQYNVEWDPGAACPMYDAWIEERVGADQVEGLEQMTSLCLDPTAVPMRSLFLFGPTRSGKSTYARIMQEVVGSQNCSAVRLRDMEQPFSAAEMYGKVLNLGADLPAGHIKELSIFKNTTGGDAIEANRKYGKKFRFINYALSVFTANEISTVGELSGAYFDRMHPVHFFGSYVGRVDPSVEAALMAERNGIFRRWVLAMQRRLAQPGRMPIAPLPQVMARFQEESDPVRAFLAECTIADGIIEPTPLHHAYVKWCDRNKKHPLGPRKFQARVTDAGFPVRKANGKRVIDLRMRRDSDSYDGEDGDERGGRDDRDGSGGKEPSAESKAGDDSASPGGVSEPSAPCAPVPFDLETDGLDFHGGDSAFVLAVGTPDLVDADPKRVVDLVRSGRPVAAHNGFGFDFAVLASTHGLDYLAASEAGLLIDTKVLAILNDPPEARMKSPNRYYSLDATAQRLAGIGKTDSIMNLAKRYGGFRNIPFAELEQYCAGDVKALEQVLAHLEVDDYARREMRLMGRLAYAMSLVGWRVDTDLLVERKQVIDQRLAEGRAILLSHGFPNLTASGSESSKPFATKAGQEALKAALGSAGVQPESWMFTDTGKVSTSKDAWTADRLAALPATARLVMETILAMNGQRTVYDTVDEARIGDRVYPTIMPFQASGRFSIQQPGLTVMGKRGGKHIEREVFLPEPGHLLVSFDLNQIDARAVAMHSQDPNYMALFQDPSIDSHAEIAFMVWGDRSRREDAKAISHGWNYGEGLTRISEAAGVGMDVVEEFDSQMRLRFPRLVEWQEEVRAEAGSGVLLDNGMGRKMRPTPGRAYTQGPALMGQGLARDLLMDGLLALPVEYVPMLRGVVHDELVFSVPAPQVDEFVEDVLSRIQFEFRGVPVTAGLVGKGRNWGEVYEKEA